MLAAQGETEAGLTTLKRAVELAAAAGFVRTFVDLGPAVAPLLRRLVADGGTTPFLHRLLGRSLPKTHRTRRRWGSRGHPVQTSTFSPS